MRKEFYSNIKDSFGPEVSPDSFTDIDLEDIPLYPIHEDDTTYVEDGLTGNTEDDEYRVMATVLDHEVPKPEANDNYVKALVMLPRGNSYARGKVIVRKRDVDGNAVGRSNYNPILDTREFNVKFDDGEVSELTSNVIA